MVGLIAMSAPHVQQFQSHQHASNRPSCGYHRPGLYDLIPRPTRHTHFPMPSHPKQPLTLLNLATLHHDTIP
ncbi:hypothetical protein HZ326_19386 [Fusarium oxysporum f. sp. albedinis]|nr:hypothetical protein HZ326_19386 [Fusarium oxysporum f. sp. albedinis]